MKRYFVYSLFVLAILSLSFTGSREGFFGASLLAASQQVGDPVNVRLLAADALVNTRVAEVVSDDRLFSKKGVALKSGTETAVDGERSEADLVFRLQVPAGRYVIYTYAVTDDEGAALMKNAKSKYESMFMRLQIGQGRPTKRVVYVPWDRPRQETGIFEITGGEEELKIWLPRGVRLEHVQLVTYVPPKVPELVQAYKPSIIPPATRPRLWVNSQLLPEVKKRLESKENRAAWERVKKQAIEPFEFTFDPEVEISFQPNLERAAEAKAFYYLMTGDKKIGREAVELMTTYLSVVEFGNLLDITRERGRAIYYGALVYDWCYDLMTSKERNSLTENLLRQAEGMEIGWPPFRQSVLTGHGNEAQVNRDLLSMSIAIYDENPLPYQYTSYRIIEELVPMRAWQYQSPRHNQGVNYGAYRTAWDMHSALLFYRMTGKTVFNDNLKELPQYWLYMRLPDGQMLRDGDGFNAGGPGEFYYWKHPFSTFLFYAYTGDPLLKSELIKQGGVDGDPVLFLLMNDPAIEPEDPAGNLPLTKDFGPILGSVIARTGWQIDLTSNDVVAEIKGGGYHFGNHQHSDAGSLQIYYRGFQVADLGLYGFYGTPYDMNFNKRSIAHSMMLVRDPEEKFLSTESNDGGTRFNQRHPDSPEIAKTDPWFHNGSVVSSDFGPSKVRPSFSYFSVDLASAYSSKVEAYQRGFCFLNLEKDSIPAAIILTDDIQAADPAFKKYWQINTHNLPEITTNGVILNNRRGGLVGKTYVEMLVPQPNEKTVEVFSGDDANSSFEFAYEVPGRINHRPYPEMTGHRIMVTPKAERKHDRFLTVFQMVAGNTNPLPVTCTETEVSYIVTISDRVVSMSKRGLINSGFTFEISAGDTNQVLLAGLNAGTWHIKSRNGKTDLRLNVADGKNTIFFQGGNGEYSVMPE